MGSFLLVYPQSLALSTVLLGLLQLTRESTLLLAVVVVTVAWRGRAYRAAGLYAGAFLIATGIVQVVTRSALPNVHGMSELAYLILKVPYNGARNLLGITFWTNTNEGCDPVTVVGLPALSILGNLHAMGLCPWSWDPPLHTALVLLTWFGVAPTLLLVALLRRLSWPVIAQVAIPYGIAAIALAPLVGASIPRVAGYGWPAFWVAVPLILSPPRRLVLLHLAVAWSPWLLPATPVLLVGVVAAHLWAAQMSRCAPDASSSLPACPPPPR
jgi:hypothetical protein